MRIQSALGGIEAVADDFIPTQLNSIVLWLRADIGVTLNGSAASTWADQSGTGHNVTQVTSSQQPTHNATDAAYNNRSSLSFAKGSSQGLHHTQSWSLNQPSTIIIVGQSDQSSLQGFVDFDTLETAIYTASATTVSMLATTAIAGAVDLNTPTVIAGVFDGATSALYVNDSQNALASGSVGSGGGTGGVVVGQLAGGGGFLNGKIAEILIYAMVLTDTQRHQVFTYLGGRYGIAIS